MSTDEKIRMFVLIKGNEWDPLIGSAVLRMLRYAHLVKCAFFFFSNLFS